MKLFFLAIALLSKPLMAGSCCIGSGPRSFVQLKHLQSYDVGIATSFRDVYARFNPYGVKAENDRDQIYTLAFGGSARVTPRSEVYGIVPLVSKTKAYGGIYENNSDLGDVSLGTKVLLYDPFYGEDWFPETKLLGAVKLPTGRADTLGGDRKIVPGTGNGMWEASLGVQFTKDLTDIVAGFAATYTRRFSRTAFQPSGVDLQVREGDRIEFTESLTVPVSQRLSFSGGSTQVVDFDTTVNDSLVSDSGGRYTTGFVGASYFVTRLWTLSAAFEAVLPIEKLSVNQQAFRTLTFTTTYAIY